MSRVLKSTVTLALLIFFGCKSKELSIYPNSVDMAPGGRVQLVPHLKNVSAKQLRWNLLESIDAGNIDGDGWYQASMVAGVVHVTLESSEWLRGKAHAIIKIKEPDGFVSLPEVALSREGHTVTRLQDGTLLIAGGHSWEGAHPNSMLFDPASGKLKDIGPMHRPRSLHTATLLSDGRVLIIGGRDMMTSRHVSGTLSLGYPPRGSKEIEIIYTEQPEVEVFDPKTQRFDLMSMSLGCSRSGHTASLLQDGRVLVVGGIRERTYNEGRGSSSFEMPDHSELVDPRRHRVEPAGPMRQARTGHTATVLQDGNVLITGGSSKDWEIEPIDSCELFSPPSASFLPAYSLNHARHGHDAVLLDDGRVLIAGGGEHETTYELYNPHTGGFELGRDTLSQAAKSPQLTLLPSGKVLMTGFTRRDGDANTGFNYSDLPDAAVFDNSLDQFKPVPNGLNEVRSGMRCVSLLDGRGLVVGGRDGNPPKKILKIERFQ
jgi:hypothetical protein